MTVGTQVVYRNEVVKRKPEMTMSKTLVRISAVTALAALPLSPAMAGDVAAQVPAPGILGLVALGVVCAIAIARGRK